MFDLPTQLSIFRLFFAWSLSRLSEESFSAELGQGEATPRLEEV